MTHTAQRDARLELADTWHALKLRHPDTAEVCRLTHGIRSWLAVGVVLVFAGALLPGGGLVAALCGFVAGSIVVRVISVRERELGRLNSAVLLLSEKPKLERERKIRASRSLAELQEVAA